MALNMNSSSLSDINCVKGEIHNVLAIMRLNNRWASPQRFEKEIPLQNESPLMRSLKSLHDELTIHGYRNLSEVDTVHFLQPFLDIVTSPLTSGPITGAALSSLHKFLLYGFVQLESLRASEGINLIASGISQCVFEESDAYSDEVVLMKVLELSALCVRCDVGTLLDHGGIVAVFTKCLQVSKEETRRSSLLRSTADNTMAHIVLVVFSRARVRTPKETEDVWGESVQDEGKEEGEEQAIVLVMETLSSMCNPRASSDQVCVLSLSLINIALEAGGDHLGLFPALVSVMQGDLCKHLLQNSQSSDLTILSLTLRVVFNLFNSIKDHLKVQLEVFLTSVHLRLLDLDVAVSPERRELALESLLEFCHEPTLMLDLYINYDCDVQCTNLFETVCSVLAVHALPRPAKGLNSINRLALDGLLSIIATLATQCAVMPNSQAFDDSAEYESDEEDGGRSPEVEEWGLKPAGLSSPSTSHAASTNSIGSEYSREGDISSDDDRPRRRKSGNLEFLAMAREKTAEVLQERKRMKRRLSLVTERFNTDESLKKFIPYAIELELLPKNPDSQAIAQLLKTTPGLDKTQIGMYIGKGPADKYPVNAAVLKAYVRLFDFSGLSFDDSFRQFLEEFRLPGEAQCIDRIMETFAAEVFRQCPHLPFKNEDAAFVLAFSLIMLNTDLHNPRIDDARRMTLDQFVSSNRDTNGGEALPFNFMKHLYHSIKDSEIELKGGIGGEMAALETGKLQWGRLVASRSGNIASASFTPSGLTSRGVYPAGVHERDMFTCIAQGTFRALGAVLGSSTDDFLVLKTLQGIYRFATIAHYYQMHDRLNGALVSLLELSSEWLKEDKVISLDTPKACFLRDLARRKEVSFPWAAGEGAAEHMGVVALHTALEIMADYGSVMNRAAWDGFSSMLTVLLDREALPTALVHLDDLTDLRGNQLKPAPYTRSPQFRSSQRTWIENDQRNSVTSDEPGLLSSFASIFWSPGNKSVEMEEPEAEANIVASVHSASEGGPDNVARSAALAMSSMLKMVLDVEALFSPVRPANEPRWSRSLSDSSLVDLMKSITDCRKDTILQSLLTLQRKKSDDLSTAKQNGGGGFWNRSAVAAANSELIALERKCEGRAVFNLELAARVLAANISRLELVYPIFFAHFQALVSSPKIATRMPFLLERSVVVVLRLWPLIATQGSADGVNFLSSIQLLLSIPTTFSLSLSDRIAYGVAGLFASTSTNQRSTSSAVWPNCSKQWGVALELLSHCASNPRGRCAVVDAMSICMHMERAPHVPVLLLSVNLEAIDALLHQLSSVEDWVNKYGSCSEGTKATTVSGENLLPPTREMLAACATSLGLLAQFVDNLISNRRLRHEALATARQSPVIMFGELLPPAKMSSHGLSIEEEEAEHHRNKLLLELGELVNESWLLAACKRALIQLRNGTELAHFSTVKASCDGFQRILSSVDQIFLLGGTEDTKQGTEWAWLFNEVLFKQGPLLRVLHTSSLRPMDSHCESRALLCCGVASQTFLHHLSLLAAYPTLLEGVVLKMATLYATVFKYTRSEAAAESLMNLLTVVQVEIRTKAGFKAVMSRAREVVDSLSPALTKELHTRAPGLHPSALHKVVMDEKLLHLQQAAEAAMSEEKDRVQPLQPQQHRQSTKQPITLEKAASFTV